MRKMVIYVLILSVMTLTAAGCGAKKDLGKREKSDVVPVKVMTVKLQDIYKTLEYVGNIKGINEAKVYPKVSGKIIEKVKEDGCYVTKGEVIAYVDRDEVGLKFEKAPIESPLTGIVGRVYVDIGSSVSTETPVALIADMSRAQIDLDVPENILPKVIIGQDAVVTVDAYPGEEFMAKVVKVSPVVDLATRAAPIELNVENKDRKLQSGMFADVHLILDVSKDVPVILKEAIIGKTPDTYVYVVEGDTTKLEKVVLGMKQGPYYEVAEGLVEGDKVVIMGQQKLRDGAVVRAEE